LTEVLVGKLGYVGIALVLVLGGLGLPVPEEAPIIVAAVLSKNERMWWPLAVASCLTGVLLGDFVVYFLGYFHGEKVLSLRLTRKFLTRAREAQIKGYFHRHGFKILILGRFAVGFRTAAYLTAGILKLPFLKLFLTDVFAASLSTGLMFGLGYVFAHQIQTSFDQVKHWLSAIVAVALAAWLLYRYYQGWRRAGLPVGPPVLVSDDVPLPPDDLRAKPAKKGAGELHESIVDVIDAAATMVPPPVAEPALPPAAPTPEPSPVHSVDTANPQSFESRTETMGRE
jgi:membrane protein DedA with SNARE-associated domain